MKLTIDTAIATFGAAARAKLSNTAATGQPEDQIRAPFEQLLLDIATLSGFPTGSVVAVGESSVTFGSIDSIRNSQQKLGGCITQSELTFSLR